jgi:hypothetical protein
VSGLILHLSILQSHVFLINSRLGHFTAATRKGDPFSRSYRVILPSSLAMNHSSALGFSPRLPVSVYGTGSNYLKLRGFSWKYDYGTIRLSEDSRYYQVQHLHGFTYDIPTPFNVLFRQYAGAFTFRHPIAIYARYRNINLLSIDYPFRVRLRSRLTLIRLALIRKP